MKMSRGKRQQLIAKCLVPKLRVGSTLPRCRELGEVMGVSYCTAHTDLHAVLREAGITWRKEESGSRIIVTNIKG